jgi:hypothetical protein
MTLKHFKLNKKDIIEFTIQLVIIFSYATLVKPGWEFSAALFGCSMLILADFYAINRDKQGSLQTLCLLLAACSLVQGSIISICLWFATLSMINPSLLASYLRMENERDTINFESNDLNNHTPNTKKEGTKKSLELMARSIQENVAKKVPEVERLTPRKDMNRTAKLVLKNFMKNIREKRIVR